MTNPIHAESVSAIPVNAEGKILLQQRDNRPGLVYAGCWTTFGGRVEDGETPDQALRRELLEEIELELPMTLWRVDDLSVWRGSKLFLVKNYVYVGRIDRPAEAIALNEGQALGYFSVDDLAHLKIGFGFEPMFREAFAQIADGTLPLA